MKNVESKNTNKKARILATFIICSIFCLVLLVSIVKMGSKLITLYENKKAVDEKLENLELQKNNLAGSIESLSTESGIEETLRDKYFVAKEGESIVVVVEEEPIVQEEKEGGLEFFRKFLEIFK
ncbi:MAG: septum formation initiator family protein [Candidatus Pacebacteria bacterium]|nr:septum formation initiator family protein [Candidatus Paceibacterota bacterium]MBP9058219.1 septum formation initiator family protein [Candidatus Paceibacterota bacterium]MBP9770306.1 septum formation initiator family protein [Candidatus Paceibacterota bacterium]